MKRLIISIFTLVIFSLGLYARQPERGYRGFIDWSNTLRSDKVWLGTGRYTTYYTGISTTHGAQLNNWLFIGGGIDFEHYSDQDSNLFTPFIEGRADLLFGKFTPFGDIRIGYNLTNTGGIYFSPSIGYRFNWGRKMGINVGVGLSLIGYSLDRYDYTINPDGYYVITGPYGKIHKCNAYFSFRIGIDF